MMAEASGLTLWRCVYSRGGRRTAQCASFATAVGPLHPQLIIGPHSSVAKAFQAFQGNLVGRGVGSSDTQQSLRYVLSGAASTCGRQGLSRAERTQPSGGRIQSERHSRLPRATALPPSTQRKCADGVRHRHRIVSLPARACLKTLSATVDRASRLAASMWLTQRGSATYREQKNSRDCSSQ